LQRLRNRLTDAVHSANANQQNHSDDNRVFDGSWSVFASEQLAKEAPNSPHSLVSG
jgi:hypothetical protein